jgi:hypothetical protein
LTFDDVALAPGAYAPLQGAYGGLEWLNFGAFNVSQFSGTSGYRIGMVSPANIVFNFSGQPATISRTAGLTLQSAYLTSAYDLRVGTFAIHIRVQGTVGTNVTYDNTYTVSNTAPALIQFNYVGVDRVIFVASPDTPFAMDNLTVTVPPPDASCTYVVSPRSHLHGFGSETGAVSVITQPGCAWSVLNTNTWSPFSPAWKILAAGPSRTPWQRSGQGFRATDLSTSLARFSWSVSPTGQWSILISSRSTICYLTQASC